MILRIAKLLNVVGTVIMIMVILICVPFTVPKLFGLTLYGVETASMEPEYPVGSVLYVKEVEASEVEVGDAITYSLGTDTELVMTHRVIEKNEADQTFITKGDANEAEDAEPISFSRLLGKPVFCMPYIAAVSELINSKYGISGMVAVFVLVLMIWMLADFLKKYDLRQASK